MHRLLNSRRGVIVVFGLLLLVLDVGRSIWARVALDTPTAIYQPDPAKYADLSWPPGADLTADTPLGKRVYAQRCAVCHGPDGRGNGPAAPSLFPRPRDFTAGVFKYKSTPAGELPTDDDLMRTVRDGLTASAMPYFGGTLSDGEIAAVVQQVKSFAPAFSQTRKAIQIPAAVPGSPASVARGKALFVSQGCAGCHGASASGGMPFDDGSGHQVLSRDLTAPWTFRGGSRAEDIWLRVTTGIKPGPMPAFAGAMSVSERWDLANYVVSIARIPPWEPGGSFGGPGFSADLNQRGSYITRWEMCGLCHTQINRTGIYNVDGAFLAGGMRIGYYPYGYSVSANLTSDAETGLGNWSVPQIVTAMRNGQAPDRPLSPFAMVWPTFHTFTDDDATSVATFLKTTLHPVHNPIPAKISYGFIETVVMKFTRPLPAMSPKKLTYADGNFAIDPAQGSRTWVQSVLVWAQWLALILGLILLVRAGPRPSIKGWIAAVPIVLIGGGLLYLAYLWPSIRGMPPDPIVQAFKMGDVTPDTRGMPEERVHMIKRGHYLYSVSCSLCHGNDGSGGLPISWKPFGTLWTRNITSDSKAGVGNWSDRELARAVRSGISRDGRQLHWQGMTWDQFSNLDEEDLRAIISYIRMLPPVDRIVPPARPPAADDCDIYAFYLDKSNVPGCRGD